MNVKISFIVIAYNIENYIEKCLTSILGQTLKEIEVIVVNDGSTDGTLDKVKNISKADDRVKILSQKNMGANAARKTGFFNATGEYVVFIDGDDWIDKALAEDMYIFAGKENSDIVCYNYYIYYNENNIVKHIDNYYENIKGYDFLNLILEEKICHTLWNKFIKKEYLDSINFGELYDGSMGEDLAANVLMAVYKPKVAMHEGIYYYYYQRNQSTMNKSSAKLLDIEGSLNCIENILRKQKIYNEFKEKVEFLWFIDCYLAMLLLTNLSIDEYHKKLFYIWKQKNIDIKKNDLCREYMKKVPVNKRLISRVININYTLGVFFISVTRMLKSKKLRGAVYG
ncbi:MAG: glycosyltransferase family 2 protein [Clostridium sp.]